MHGLYVASGIIVININFSGCNGFVVSALKLSRRTAVRISPDLYRDECFIIKNFKSVLNFFPVIINAQTFSRSISLLRLHIRLGPLTILKFKDYVGNTYKRDRGTRKKFKRENDNLQ